MEYVTEGLRGLTVAGFLFALACLYTAIVIWHWRKGARLDGDEDAKPLGGEKQDVLTKGNADSGECQFTEIEREILEGQ
jgi:hypothetical protein